MTQRPGMNISILYLNCRKTLVETVLLCEMYQEPDFSENIETANRNGGAVQ